MNTLTIGKLAKKAGVTIDTVRFYERCGLIKEPARTQSNYRIYPEEEVAHLRFVKKAKELGFSLNEIKQLLKLQNDPKASKSDVKEWTEKKIREIRSRIKDLSRILAALEQLTGSCDGQGPVNECPIIGALSDDSEESKHHHH